MKAMLNWPKGNMHLLLPLLILLLLLLILIRQKNYNCFYYRRNYCDNSSIKAKSRKVKFERIWMANPN